MIFEPEIPHFHRQLIIDEIKKIGAETVLDVGCGVGTMCFYLKRDLPELEYTGIDSQMEKIDGCIKNYGDGKRHFQEGSVNNIPLPDKSFDVVLIDAVLMYLDIPERELAINEMKRVAKKAIIICEPTDYKIEADVKHSLKEWGGGWEEGFIQVKYL